MEEGPWPDFSPAVPPVLLTGLGILTAPPLRELLAGDRGAPPETAPELTAFEAPEGAPAFAFEIPGFRLEDYLPHYVTYLDRCSALSLAAARLALGEAGLLPAVGGGGVAAETGCAYGSVFGCLESLELFRRKARSGNPKFAPPLVFTHSYANTPSSLLCLEYGLRGPAATFAGEALAGLEALFFAVEQIAAGRAERMLVCAAEALSRPLYAHLFAAGRLSRTGRPALWEGEEAGVVPGEGAVALLLEGAAAAVARGRRAWGRLAGWSLVGGEGEGRWDSAAREAWGGGPRESAGAVPSRSGQGLLLFPAAPADRGAAAAESRFWRGRTAPAGPVARMCARPYVGELFAAAPLLNVALAALALNDRLPAVSLTDLEGRLTAAVRATAAVAAGAAAGQGAGLVLLAAHRGAGEG